MNQGHPMGHFKGPWRRVGNRIEGKTDRKAYPGDDGYRTICSVKVVDLPDTINECEANMRLLLQAANYYDAAERMRETFITGGPEFWSAVADILLAHVHAKEAYEKPVDPVSELPF